MKSKSLFVCYHEAVIPILATEFDKDEAVAMHIGSDRTVLLMNLQTLEGRVNMHTKMRGYISAKVHKYIFDNFDELPDYYNLYMREMYSDEKIVQSVG